MSFRSLKAIDDIVMALLVVGVVYGSVAEGEVLLCATSATRLGSK